MKWRVLQLCLATLSTDEAARSRLYGGIHYASGNTDGLAQGRCIGQVILDRIAFKH